MANNFKVATATRDNELNALARDLDGGFMRIYDGTQPASADTAITSQNLLAELALSATSAPSASSGSLTLNAITSDADANLTGTAAWFRMVKSDATTAVCDGTVGTSSADAIINTTSIVQHARVDCTSCVISL